MSPFAKNILKGLAFFFACIGVLYFMIAVYPNIGREERMREYEAERERERAALRAKYPTTKEGQTPEKAVEAMRRNQLIAEWELRADSHLVVRYVSDWNEYKRKNPNGKLSRKDFDFYLGDNDAELIHIIETPKLIWKLNLKRATVITPYKRHTATTTLTPADFKEEFRYPDLLTCEYFEFVESWIDDRCYRRREQTFRKFRNAKFTKLE